MTRKFKQIENALFLLDKPFDNQIHTTTLRGSNIVFEYGTPKAFSPDWQNASEAMKKEIQSYENKNIVVLWFKAWRGKCLDGCFTVKFSKELLLNGCSLNEWMINEVKQKMDRCINQINNFYGLINHSEPEYYRGTYKEEPPMLSAYEIEKRKKQWEEMKNRHESTGPGFYTFDAIKRGEKLNYIFATKREAPQELKKNTYAQDLYKKLYPQGAPVVFKEGDIVKIEPGCYLDWNEAKKAYEVKKY